MNKTIPVLFFLLLLSSCADDEQQAALTQQLTEAQATIDSLKQKQQGSVTERPGVMYSIYFWMNDNFTDAERSVLLQKLSEWQLIESVRAFYIARPARTVTEGSDHSYDYMAVAFFDDRAGFNAFQNHSYYLQFMQTMSGDWDRIQVYVSDVR